VELRRFLSNCCAATSVAIVQKYKLKRSSEFPVRGLWIALLLLIPIWWPAAAHASSNGISGFSGMSGSTCTSCHSNGTSPTVTLTGPTSVASGSTNTYTIAVSTITSGNGGVDVAASAGTFAAGTGTKVSNGEIVHSSPSSTHSWTFSWTAPTVTATTTATLYAAAIDSFGGGTGTLKQAITVTAAATKPTLSVSPSTLSFSYQSGGTVPGAQTISTSSSGAALSYTTTTSASWLTATPSGTTPTGIRVSVSPSALSAGTYTGTVTITASGASNSPQTVAVTLNVTAATQPTLTVSPANLSFAYQTGGTTPAAQMANVTGSSTLTYSAAASATWLTVTPASGSTPGNLSIGVNPASLAAGTYTGSVTVTASGASNSPQKVSVTLTVSSGSSGNASLNVSPGTVSFTYPSGSTATGTQNLSITSSGSPLSITAAASGGSWLTVTPASGSTPATLKVSANTTGLAAGTYKGTINITSSNASNSPQTVPVTLTITGTGSGTLRVYPPRAVAFEYEAGRGAPSPRSVRVYSSGGPLSFTAAAHGGTWLSVNPSGGTTPGSLTVSADPTGLASGTYTATIAIAAPGSKGVNLPVILRVASGDDDGGGDDGGGGGSGGGGGGGDDGSTIGGIHAWPYAYDPAATNSVAATWMDNTGVASTNANTADTRNQGLLLSKTSAASNQAQAGVVIREVEGISLTELGYDIRSGSQCTATSPRFVVVTSDGVVHKIGCTAGTAQSAPATGWKRLRFDPANGAQTVPAIAPGSKVTSIHLVLDGGPETGSSMAVIDNIDINAKIIGQQ
jgi:hypothetical protein